jgi:hypothetical protein
MNIGIFYQSGHKLVACYMALMQLRRIYPNIPIALYEDGSNLLQEIAQKFKCDYKHLSQTGINNPSSGRVFIGKNGQIEWLQRIYESCLTTLKDCEWIVHYEDDVWCLNPITKPPKFDINGANGPLYNNELYLYLKHKFNVIDDSHQHWSEKGSLQSYGACGGAIFNRLKFISIFENLDRIPWDEIYKLDSRPIEWCDATLSFVFQYNGFSSGIWNDWAQYDSKNQGNWFDKTGWSIPMKYQPNVAFLHSYKHFYNYKENELEEAINKIDFL